MPAAHLTLSVPVPTVVAMEDKQPSRRLRVVRESSPSVGVDDEFRAAYWARVRALKVERARLRAG